MRRVELQRLNGGDWRLNNATENLVGKRHTSCLLGRVGNARASLPIDAGTPALGTLRTERRRGRARAHRLTGATTVNRSDETTVKPEMMVAFQ
jgi:hypothetical protein